MFGRGVGASVAEVVGGGIVFDLRLGGVVAA
jgi:hypothetical protein